MSELDAEALYAEFCRSFNANDLDALCTLYEPNATFVRGASDYVSDRAALREALQGFLALGGRLSMKLRHAVPCGDIALLSNEWRLDAADADGKPMTLTGRTAEVVRRQPDGRWLFAIDHPYGAQD